MTQLNDIGKLQPMFAKTAFTAFAVSIIFGNINTAEAAFLHNGWNYALDSANDSTYRDYVGGPTRVGGGIFEGYGIAYKDDIANNRIHFAINANLPQNGATVPQANGYGHIGWGDFFIRSGQRLLGIHSTHSNDSGVSEFGVYDVSRVKDVTNSNDGWPFNSTYTNFVNSNGGNARMGDLAQSESPFGNVPNSLIATGTKIADIFSADFTGLDFGGVGARGSNTFGFSISRSLLSTGDFLGWIIQECANDWMAIKGFLSPVVVTPPIQTPVVVTPLPIQTPVVVTPPTQPPLVVIVAPPTQPPVVVTPPIQPPVVVTPPIPTPTARVPEPSSLLGIFSLGAFGILGFVKRKQEKVTDFIHLE